MDDLVAALVGRDRAVEDDVVGDHRAERLTIPSADGSQQVHAAIMRTLDKAGGDPWRPCPLWGRNLSHRAGFPAHTAPTDVGEPMMTYEPARASPPGGQGRAPRCP